MPRLVLISRLYSLLSLVALAAIIGGCGFQPRGHEGELGSMPSPVYIAGIGRFSPLHRELVAQLQRAGVATSATSADSAVVLLIRDLESDSRLLTVDSRNRAVEFELEESARFEIRSPDQQVPAKLQRVRVLRIQFQPPETILASQREAALLREDMRRELAQRMLQRVAAQR